jgi:hypothetical protein
MIAQQATFALESLDKAKITAQADKNGLVQKAGEPRYRLGDTWVIAVIDDYSGREIRRSTARVSKIENGLVYIDHGDGQEIKTIDGATVENLLNKFDPPRVDLPGDELKVGKKWTASSYQMNSRIGRSLREEEFKVIGFEEITVPAGVFKTYKIEATAMLENGVTATRTYWVEPGWGVNIKTKRAVRQRRGPATLETYLLISRSRGAV